MKHTSSFLRKARTQASIAAVILLSACATTEEPGAKLLTDADTKLTAEDYRGAIASYKAFVGANPEHPQALRARATQRVLERLAAAQAATTRTQQGTDVTRKELAEKQAEADKLRAEVAKLRADLDRLRSIDLQSPRSK